MIDNERLHTAYNAYLSAVKTPHLRVPELEQGILQSNKYILYYAEEIIKGRWHEAEPIIMQDAQHAYFYARDIIKGRWPEAEPFIMKEVAWAYAYAVDIIKGRWSEAEPYIMQDAKYIYLYANCVIQDRWIEAEEIVAKSFWKKEYIEAFFEEQVVTQQDVGEFRWNQKKPVGYFAPISMFQRQESILDRMVKG